MFSAIVVWSYVNMTNQVKLADTVILIIHILVDFLSTCSISQKKRDIKIPDYNCRFLSISPCSYINFCFSFLEHLLLGDIKLYLFSELTLCNCEMNFLIPGQILCVEIYFDNNIATPAFFD